MRVGGYARIALGHIALLCDGVLLCVLLLRCGFRGGVLAPHLADWHRLHSYVALRAVWRFLAPLLAAAAALWLPPAAKEGQGDCDFPLGPPWIFLYPLKRRRSAEGLEAAKPCILVQGSAVVAKGWGGWSCSAFCRCIAVFAAAFLRRFWLRQQPRGCLRRPRRARGIAISP